MAERRSGGIRKFVDTALGREPAPPVPGHPEPFNKHDRRQFFAILLSFILIVTFGFVVSQYELFDFSMREIPPEEQLPGREVISPTATP